jgi:glutamate-1-semialdehyde 2,1-aminomutase
VVSVALSREGVPHRLQSAGNLFSIFFAGKEVRTFTDAQSQDTKAFAAFFHSMLENGVSLPPSAYEAWFVSGAHTEADVEQIATAAAIAAKAATKIEG